MAPAQRYKKASSKERAAAEILKKDLTTEHYHLGFNDDPARQLAMNELLDTAQLASHLAAVTPRCVATPLHNLPGLALQTSGFWNLDGFSERI